MGREMDTSILEHTGDHREQQHRHARRHQPIYSDTSDTIEHRSHYSFQVLVTGIDWARTLPRLYKTLITLRTLYTATLTCRLAYPYIVVVPQTIQEENQCEN